MELWVRTQDKEGLLKINRGIMYWLVENKRHTIVNQENEAGLSIIAEYKTKERALQVLDEIQNILKPVIINKQIKSDGMLADGLSDGVLHTYNVNEIKELSTYVYEMPEE